MAADSVAVNQPMRIPPTTMKIIRRDGTAFQTTNMACPKLRRSVLFMRPGMRREAMKTRTITESTHTSPGPTPAMNSAAIEVLDTSEYTMNVLLGGISIPDGAEATLTAAAHARSYFSWRILGVITVPMAAAEATAAPDTAPNMAFASTFVCASAAGAFPVSALAASMSRVAIPPLFIRTPARTKNGIASSGNELMPV